MKKKKLGKVAIILIIFALLSAPALFAGGGKETPTGEEKSGPVELSFWSLFTGGDGEFFDAMIEEFNRTHDDIIMTTDTVKYTDYYTKLTTALTSKNAPDVVVMHRDRLLNYVPKGVLVPLNDKLAVMNAPMDDFVPAALEGCQFDGETYALPLDIHALILYYNKALFAQAGVSAVPESYAEVVKAAEMIQSSTDVIGIAADNTTATYKAYTLTRLFMSFLEQQGVSILSEDASKATFNNSEGEKALKGLIDMVNLYGITPSGMDYDSSVSSFKLGKAGMHINGVWATGGFENQEGLEFAAVPLPPMFGQPAAWSGSHTLAVPVQSKIDDRKMEAIITFMLWMTEHGEMWAKAGHIPIRLSVAKNPDFIKLPYRADYADAAKYSFPAPRTAAWGEIYGNVSDALELAVATNADVKSTLSSMEEMVNSIIATY